MNRSFKPEGFGGIAECSLCHFSDAGQNGYGQASYLRLVDEKGTDHYSLVMGKSHVTPTKFVSFPKLELAAAALSVKILLLLRKELSIHPIIKEYFWTDSKVVLAYLNNDVKRFKVYVANRVKLIHDHSDLMQWNYIESKKNPASDTSRGVLPSNAAKVKCWVNAPKFLWKEESTWPSQNEVIQDITSDDPEVKKSVAVNTASSMKENMVAGLQMQVSDWNKMVRIMAWVMKFVKILHKKRQGACSAQKNPTLMVDNLQEAELNF